MTCTFAVNENNDIYLEADKKLALATQLPALLHICANVAKTIYNEMLYAKGQGLPNFETIWTSQANIIAWEMAFRSHILQIQNVTAIESFKTWRENNTLKYAATIKTLYGEGEIYG